MNKEDFFIHDILEAAEKFDSVEIGTDERVKGKLCLKGTWMTISELIIQMTGGLRVREIAAKHGVSPYSIENFLHDLSYFFETYKSPTPLERLSKRLK